MAQVRALSHGGVEDLRARCVDFPNEYKTIALREASNDAATVCYINPEDNKPYKARILVQPFGSRRAPANWGRVVTFIQFIAREILSLAVAAFVDDVFCDEPASAQTSGFWAFKRLSGLIGFFTSDKKDQRPTTALPPAWGSGRDWAYFILRRCAAGACGQTTGAHSAGPTNQLPNTGGCQ